MSSVWLPPRTIHSSTTTERLLEAKSMQVVVYMDFKKAFDSISHDDILQKLYAAGITVKLWFWLQSYFKHRFQCVRIGVSLSTVVLNSRDR